MEKCKICQSPENELIFYSSEYGLEFAYAKISGYKLEVGSNDLYDFVKINYCPMCGRKLEERAE